MRFILLNSVIHGEETAPELKEDVSSSSSEVKGVDVQELGKKTHTDCTSAAQPNVLCSSPSHLDKQPADEASESRLTIF